MTAATVEFVGTPSGDGECFCWVVDRATFTRLTGDEPDDWDATPGGFRVYPGLIFPHHDRAEAPPPVRVVVTVTPVEDPTC